MFRVAGCTLRIKQDQRGVSNIIVVVLGLLIIVIIVTNVFLWNYEMNQLDWEKMREDMKITNVAPATNSSWFVTQSEYTVNTGTRVSGTYTDTQSIDSLYETFREALPSFQYGYAFQSSNVRVTTTSGTPVDDAQAALNVTLASDSYIFVIYNAGSGRGSTEDRFGKGGAINVDGQDKAFSWQSTSDFNSADSVTVVWADFLTAGAHTIKGRFFANQAGNTIGIDRRQIVAFWFPTVTAQYVRSAVSAATTSGSPVDDPQAVLTITLANDSPIFIVYNAGNQDGSTEPRDGKGITLNIDGSDISTKQWQSPFNDNTANSVTIAYVTSLTTGSHTIKGRFFSNTAGSTTTIDERQLIAFAFPSNSISYGFAESTTSVTTTSGTAVNDSESVLSPTLGSDSDSLIMYVGGNSPGATEDREGKGMLLSVDATDKSNSTSWQSAREDNFADSATSIWYEQLANGSHTIRGRFLANQAGLTVTISHRQLLILAFPKSSTNNYRLDVNGTFVIDVSTYPLGYIQTVEIQLRYRANDTGEKWYLQAYNWTALAYSDNGFNTTAGHTPTTGWDRYAVNLTSSWQSYVDSSGTMYVKLLDNGPDSNITTIDIDFLGVRAVINGTNFTLKNEGSFTTHLVSLWIINSTTHRRYDSDVFINSADTLSYIRADISPPSGQYTVKFVTERGNIAIYSGS